MTTETKRKIAVPKSRSRNVNSYIKAELRLRRLDDQLRARLDALAPLRERVRTAKDLAWLKWHKLNGGQAREAVKLVGEGRKTILGEKL